MFVEIDWIVKYQLNNKKIDMLRFSFKGIKIIQFQLIYDPQRIVSIQMHV